MMSQRSPPRFCVLITVVNAFLVSTFAQNIFDCPTDWVSFNGFCYKFEGDFPRKFDEATAACSTDGASLLYVESIEENTFIKNRLESGDPYQRKWLTSGHGGTSEGEVDQGDTAFVWEAISSPIRQTLQFWSPGHPDPKMDTSTAAIAYAIGENGYGWSLVSDGDAEAYVCKIAQKEAYRIVQKLRGYDYGMDVEDVNVLERGPHFVVTPHSVVVVGETGEQAVLECLASANPEPTYKWFRGNGFTEEVTSETDSRYTLTNGRLAIQSPQELVDAGEYRCQASNNYGTIVSGSVKLSFGFIAEFSNVANEPARANAYDGFAIQCSPLLYKPAVQYQWLKDQTQFIRTDMQAYIFISNNGKIYFSEVTRADQGEYKCIAVLTGVNQYTIGTTQPPTRVSLPIPLQLTDQAPKANWGPEIQNDFPAVYPQPPLRGQDVRLECFAYGSSTTPFSYSWRREGKPIPATASLEDHNRVMIIRNAQLEDSGTYTCTASRSTAARDSRSIYLSLAARPYFVAPLQDQHADVGSQLTWRCDARANPSPVYTWYRNGQLLTSEPSSRIQVSGNILTITDLQASLHDGMYQCGATNSHGTEMSNAQLRVLSFPPSFRKAPLPSQLTGSREGDISIICRPEGAPFPIITWQKNGGTLTPDGSHVTQLSNGNLLIRNLSPSDEGQYTCNAENELGSDSSSTRLVLATGASISVGPVRDTVLVNSTTFIPCQFSAPPRMDTTFVWYFNGHLIDTDLPDYTKLDKSSSGQTGLYVKSVQFKHEGMYRCSLRTPFTEDYREGYLTVKGPPNMPAGVRVDQLTVTQYGMSVLWTVGEDNGGTIIAYVIQAEDEFNKGLWRTVGTVRAQDTVQAQTQTQTDKRRAAITDLNPGTSYRFRIMAQNEYGLGTPSRPSAYMKTLDAPPAVPPRNVRGGGGSVGMLTMEWDLLNRAEWGSRDLQYIVYWRKKVDGLRQALWQKKVTTSKEAMYSKLVGENNYYLLYQMKVQAVNSMGPGPNSTVVDVYSAEGMPPIAPTNVIADTFNSSALFVTWDIVPDTRETVRGKILGYQINYWPVELQVGEYVRFIRHYGQVGEGLVIGLDVDVYNWVDVQVFNTAGLGPRSEAYQMETTGFPPLTYPQEVRVYSAGPGKATVWWRGVSMITDEEGLEGYALYIWNANELAQTAEPIDLPRWTNEYLLTDLEESTLYALRVAGINSGGYGRKSPTMYFTFAGSVFIDYAFSRTIDVFMAPAAVPRVSLWLLVLLLTMSSLICRRS